MQRVFFALIAAALAVLTGALLLTFVYSKLYDPVS